MTTIKNPCLQGFYKKLDSAVEGDDDCAITQRVKAVLEEFVCNEGEFLPEHLMAPTPGTYARRLLYADPEGRYSVLVMVWDENQGTALHDHAAIWCVECVYKGKIKVTSYSCDAEQDGLYQFTPQKEVLAGCGQAGALIPPFDYHVLQNAGEKPAVTIHIYGGEMTWCHIFEPGEGGYRMRRKPLAYSPQ